MLKAARHAKILEIISEIHVLHVRKEIHVWVVVLLEEVLFFVKKMVKFKSMKFLLMC